MSKAEKRALKFAIQRGEDIDKIPNLKEFLGQQVKMIKQKKHVREVNYDIKGTKYDRGGNNSNKFYAFT